MNAVELVCRRTACTWNSIGTPKETPTGCVQRERQRVGEMTEGWSAEGGSVYMYILEQQTMSTDAYRCTHIYIYIFTYKAKTFTNPVSSVLAQAATSEPLTNAIDVRQMLVSSTWYKVLDTRYLVRNCAQISSEVFVMNQFTVRDQDNI